jgi:hypothetical protein
MQGNRKSEMVRKNTQHENNNHKKVAVATLMPDSTDFKTWTITRYKEIAGWVW